MVAPFRDEDFFVADFLPAVFFDAAFLDAPFLAGTFAPAFLASDNAIAMACLREVTFLPLPLFKVPRFFSRITVSTFLPAALEYFAMIESLKG